MTIHETTARTQSKRRKDLGTMPSHTQKPRPYCTGRGPTIHEIANDEETIQPKTTGVLVAGEALAVTL
ncbi:MAG: ribosomal protein S8E [Rhodococcus sp. (in: high G+C Gram-positive bacteria)]